MKTELGKKLLLLASVIIYALAASPSQAEESWRTLPRPHHLPRARESGYIAANGCSLYYATYGNGDRSVLLLHGGLANSEYWGNQIPMLVRQKYKVVTIDSRGHGRSSRDDQPLSYHLMAADVLSVLDQLRIERTSIVGWSDGAIIGLDIAINHPERLDCLFSFAANYNTSGVRDDAAQNPTFKKYLRWTEKDYQRLSKTPEDYPRFFEAVSKMWATEPNFSTSQLNAISRPTAIVDGEFDEAIKSSHTKELATLVPNSRLIILGDVSHFAFLQKPQVFNSAVVHFLK
jgi:pimeloyl-ACP methyl ester carboxylesterase